MFCPSCGAREDQPIQFCRSCGSSFRPVVDEVTSSAMSAREEIGRAMADKIREFESSKDLKRIAEDVLPELEKFLESPAEKRLRRMRNGTLVASIGLAVSIGLSILAVATDSPRNIGYIWWAAAGLVTLFVGLALVINGYLHTVPKDREGKHNEPGMNTPSLVGTTSHLGLPGGEPLRPFSVTESTTTHLAEKQPIRRD